MDKEEKPHTPRNVSRIFMFTTALQCSILSLSYFVGWTPFGGSLCKKCTTQSGVLAQVGWFEAHLCWCFSTPTFCENPGALTIPVVPTRHLADLH